MGQPGFYEEADAGKAVSACKEHSGGAAAVQTFVWRRKSYVLKSGVPLLGFSIHLHFSRSVHLL